jgi:hypothetical protein
MLGPKSAYQVTEKVVLVNIVDLTEHGMSLPLFSGFADAGMGAIKDRKTKSVKLAFINYSFVLFKLFWTYAIVPTFISFAYTF